MTADDINTEVEKSFEESSIVFTNDSTSYVDISNYVEFHISEKSSDKLTK